MANIVGLNFFHGDASACLVKDGKLIAAVEEERFTRHKHDAAFPAHAIRYCLAEGGLAGSDVDVLALNTDPRANLFKKAMYTLRTRPEIRMVAERLRNRSRKRGVGELFADAVGGANASLEVRHVEHHLAHLASAFLPSPFERATTVSVDGFGDFASAAWGLCEGSSVSVADRVLFPHSLGIFYMAVTQHIGFPNYGDEYKVMGLAPYGEDRHAAQMDRILLDAGGGRFELALDYFRHHDTRIEMNWEGGSPRYATLFNERVAEVLGPRREPDQPLEQRHRDLARSAQAAYERAFFRLLTHLHGQYDTDALCLAGGCAMNSVANGKVTRNTPFARIYVQAAAGDAGGAVGAALAVAAETGAARAGARMAHAYWGPSYDRDEIAACLARNADAIRAAGVTVEVAADEQALVARASQAIASGAVLGWFQGRAEWGPRALGNRSILADPRLPNVRDLLNLKIKRRESFRPFAPSILREAVDDWFETTADVPFMMQVFQVREPMRARIPAVTHVDGSGRLQTVSDETNPRYARLIRAFAEQTGVPIVLNTSFNENEPIVCTPQEALDCFLRTRMDMLVLGETVLARPAEATAT